ncbi:MAG: OmpA family protein [Cyclobacteriaceae bacterium]
MNRSTFVIFLLTGFNAFAQPLASSQSEKSHSHQRNAISGEGSIENLAPAYAVKLVPFNSSRMDFSPFPYKNGIVFLSSRPQKESGHDSQEGFLNLFYTEEAEDGTFSTPELLNKDHNTPYHLGPTVFFDHDNKKIVTRNSFYKNSKMKDGSAITLELAQSVLNASGKWSELITIPLGSSEYSVGHPAISSDGSTLYFSSNMPGTLGGSDLFVSQFQNGLWSTPKNLGPKINTAGQELFPYLHNDSILFFSSTAHNSLGGLDIFSCNLKSTNLIVMQMDAPVNSLQDDFGIFLDPRGISGFISSNRLSEGSDDIYYFEEIQQFVKFQLYDSVTGDYIRTAKLNLSSGERILSQAESDLMGSLEFRLSPFRDYQVSISHPDYKSSAIELKTFEWTATQQPQIKVYLSPVQQSMANKKLSVALQTKGQKALTNTISFSSAPLDVDFASEATPLPTDSTGISVDSDALPLVRVIVVENVNGLPSLMVIRNDSIYDFSVTSNNTLGNSNLNFQINIPQGAKRNDFEQIISNELSGYGYAVGKFLLIRSFYFDSEKTLIRNDAMAQLDKIIEVMVTYPQIDVQLIFHSDSRGTNKFNLELSRHRSDEVTGYLTSAGIKKEQILSRFVGEGQLLNDCGDLSDCGELMHQMNRTIEFNLILRKKTSSK